MISALEGKQKKWWRCLLFSDHTLDLDLGRIAIILSTDVCFCLMGFLVYGIGICD